MLTKLYKGEKINEATLLEEINSKELYYVELVAPDMVSTDLFLQGQSGMYLLKTNGYLREYNNHGVKSYGDGGLFDGTGRFVHDFEITYSANKQYTIAKLNFIFVQSVSLPSVLYVNDLPEKPAELNIEFSKIEKTDPFFEIYRLYDYDKPSNSGAFVFNFIHTVVKHREMSAYLEV